MVGGIVVRTERVDSERLWVLVRGRGCESRQECGVDVVDDTTEILPGDSLWWQGDKAMWTPQDATGERCGIDYDIQLKRTSGSGVPSPTTRRLRQHAEAML